MIKKGSLTPTKLRLLLSISMFLIVAAGIGLFYVVEQHLKMTADSVSKATASANASRNNIKTLQAIKDELAKQQDAIKRANDIAASSQSYNYQNQVISDLNTYATRAGVTITNIDFATAAAPGAANTSTATPAVPAAPGAPAAAPASPAPSGLRTATVSVTLKSPLDYTSLLNFFNMLEQSVPKLQIAKVNLSKSGSGGSVTSDVLSIEVYIR